MHFLVEELGQELYNEDSSCSEGTVKATEGAAKVTVKYGDEAVSVYRGGNSFTIKSGEIKIDSATGMVKDTHGISLDVNPNTVSKFGGAYKIDSLPDGLKIIQRGTRAEHFEIVPTRPMTVDEIQGLLNQIKTSPVK